MGTGIPRTPSLESKHQIRRPPLWGHHSCGFRIPSASQQSSVLRSAIQSSAAKLFTSPCLGLIHHCHTLNSGQQKSGNQHLKASKKKTRIDPGIHKNNFCGNLFSRTLGVHTSIQNTVQPINWKQTRKEIAISGLSAEQLSKWSPQIPELNGNLNPDPLVSFLLRPWTSRVPPKC